MSTSLLFQKAGFIILRESICGIFQLWLVQYIKANGVKLGAHLFVNISEWQYAKAFWFWSETGQSNHLKHHRHKKLGSNLYCEFVTVCRLCPNSIFKSDLPPWLLRYFKRSDPTSEFPNPHGSYGNLHRSHVNKAKNKTKTEAGKLGLLNVTDGCEELCSRRSTTYKKVQSFVLHSQWHLKSI